MYAKQKKQLQNIEDAVTTLLQNEIKRYAWLEEDLKNTRKAYDSIPPKIHGQDELV